MHVKISERGRRVLRDKALTSKLVRTVMDKKDELEDGNSVQVDNSNIKVRLVTARKSDTEQ